MIRKLSVWDGELDHIHSATEEISGSDSDSILTVICFPLKESSSCLISWGHCAFLSFGKGFLNLSTMPFKLECEEKIYVTSMPQKLWALE